MFGKEESCSFIYTSQILKTGVGVGVQSRWLSVTRETWKIIVSSSRDISVAS